MTRPLLGAFFHRQFPAASDPHSPLTPFAERVVQAVRDRRAADRIVLVHEDETYFPEPGQPANRRRGRELAVLWERPAHEDNQISGREDRMLNLRDALARSGVRAHSTRRRDHIHQFRQRLAEGGDWTIGREDLHVDNDSGEEIDVSVHFLTGTRGNVNANAPEGWLAPRSGITVNAAQVEVRVPIDKSRAVYIESGPSPRVLATHITALAIDRAQQQSGINPLEIARQLSDLSHHYAFSGNTASMLQGSLRSAQQTMEITVSAEALPVVIGALEAAGGVLETLELDSSFDCACELSGRSDPRCPHHAPALKTTAGSLRIKVVGEDEFRAMSVTGERRQVGGVNVPLVASAIRSAVPAATRDHEPDFGLQRGLRRPLG